MNNNSRDLPRSPRHSTASSYGLFAGCSRMEYLLNICNTSPSEPSLCDTTDQVLPSSIPCPTETRSRNYRPSCPRTVNVPYRVHLRIMYAINSNSRIIRATAVQYVLYPGKSLNLSPPLIEPNVLRSTVVRRIWYRHDNSLRSRTPALASTHHTLSHPPYARPLCSR